MTFALACGPEGERRLAAVAPSQIIVPHDCDVFAR